MDSGFIPGFTTNLSLSKEQVWDEVDRLEGVMFMAGGNKGQPPIHTFTDGLYTRTLFMPAGMFLTSEIHNTQHQYFVLTGRALVWTWESGWDMVTAPRQGITEPNTRRIIYVYDDLLWATVHPNPENITDPNVIMDRILHRHINPYIDKALSL